MRSVIRFKQLPATDDADRDENRKTENEENENISPFSFPPQSISTPSFLFQSLPLFRRPCYAPRRRVRLTFCFRQQPVGSSSHRPVASEPHSFVHAVPQAAHEVTDSSRHFLPVNCAVASLNDSSAGNLVLLVFFHSLQSRSLRRIAASDLTLTTR